MRAGSLRVLWQDMPDLFIPPARFAAPDEARFLHDYALQHLGQRQLYLVLAVPIWLAFAYWDYHHWINHSEQFPTQVFVQVMVLRVVGALWICWAMALSFTPRFAVEREASCIMTLTLIIAMLCLFAMMSLLPAPLNYDYYFVGIILVLFFQQGTLALLARYSLISIGMSILLLLGQDTLHHPLQAFFFPAVFYLLVFSFVGWAVCVKLERGARERYLHLGHLAHNYEKLESASQAILREKHKADAALRALFDQEIEKARQLDEKTQATTRFVRAAYHDTLQPLASIGALTLAGQTALSSGQTARVPDLLRQIAISAREINQLFKGLHDLFIVGDTAPVIEPVSLNGLLDELQQVFAQPAAQRRLQLKVVRRQRDLWVASDRALLIRVLGNLVGNAIKYTEHGGVLVKSLGLGAKVRIDIVDTGPGIDAGLGQRIFDEFFQVNPPQELDRERGMGLGLFIVRTFVARLPRHRVSYASRVGHGSRFSLDCPLTRGLPPPSSLASEQAAAASCAGLYLLIVDDDSRILRSLAQTFELLDATVVTANGLADLKRHLCAAPDRYPDLLITDYQLSTTDTGLDVIGAVRAAFAWAQVPAVVYSARLPAQPISGVEDVRLVSKADDIEVLLQAVQDAARAGAQANARLAGQDSTPST